VLYQMLTGERPFEGSMTAIMHKVLNIAPPRPSELSVTAPEPLDAVVTRAMAKRPEQRFASADEFAQALRAALEGQVPPPETADLEATMVSAPSSAAAVRAAATAQAAANPAAVASAAQASALSSRPGRDLAQSSTGAATATRNLVPLLAGAAVVVLAGAGGGWYWLTARAPAPPPTTLASAAPPIAPPSLPGVAQPSDAAPPATPPSPPAAAAPIPSQSAAPAPGVATPAPSASSQQAATTPQPAPSPAPSPAPAPVTAVIVPPPPVPPSPARLRTMLQTAAATVPCTLPDGTVDDDGNITLAGLAGRASEATLRQRISEIAARAPMTWNVATFDGPFCKALDVIRPVARRFGTTASNVQLQLKSGPFKLHENDSIVPRFVMPDYTGYAQLSYITSDGTLLHLYPGNSARQVEVATPNGKRDTFKVTAGESRLFPAGAVVHVADPESCHCKPEDIGWQVAPPYGTDMMLITVSSAPLFAQPRPDDDTAETYLRDLQAALESAVRRGARVNARAILVGTEPR